MVMGSEDVMMQRAQRVFVLADVINITLDTFEAFWSTVQRVLLHNNGYLNWKYFLHLITLQNSSEKKILHFSCVNFPTQFATFWMTLQWDCLLCGGVYAALVLI